MYGDLVIGMGKHWGKHSSLVPTRVETVAVEVNRGVFRPLEQWLLAMWKLYLCIVNFVFEQNFKRLVDEAGEN